MFLFVVIMKQVIVNLLKDILKEKGIKLSD